MSATLETSYQPIQPFPGDLGEEETPQESGVMIHVVPESGKARWNHIEDLDSFFARMYHYHQKHGFMCMMLQETLELLQFIFIVVFTTFLFHCVDYQVLFRDEKPRGNIPGTSLSNGTIHKVSLGDAVIPFGECMAHLGALTWIFILVAMVFWFLRFIKVLYHLIQFWEIKSFFNTALKIDDSELDNLTWHEVQKRVREVQLEQQMCIHKQDLSELDIYHRILRFKNYMVAMVNKSLLPVRLNIPIIGETVFLTRGLKYNIELLLFWGPWSPFENNWHLKEDFKKLIKRKELARRLSKQILWIGIANFVLCPVILLWQILFSFFNYAEVIKREPSSLGSRCWSLYGRLYLRHFNELDHELNARLNRAYRPASKYMAIFTSPLMAVIAKNIAFVTGALLAVLVLLTVYDEDVLTVDHVLTAITVLGVIVAICRAFIPDENLVWCPEALMTAVLAHAHYLPDGWRGRAHTSSVRSHFSQLFQYKAVYLLEELLSPLVTPFILCFHIRKRALDIVDFYRNFTVEVVGVGDVCSFAQMDVRRHGQPTWQMPLFTQHTPPEQPPSQQSSGGEDRVIPMQAENGKTELSLVHFTLTNPEWRMPPVAEDFVEALRRQAQRDVVGENGGSPWLHLHTNPLYSSLHSISSLGVGYGSLVASALGGGHGGPSAWPPFAQQQESAGDRTSPRQRSMGPGYTPAPVRKGMSRAEGPMQSSDGRSLLLSIHQARGTPVVQSAYGLDVNSPSLLPGLSPQGQWGPEVVPELTVADMSLGTLYLHELHHRQMSRGLNYSGVAGGEGGVSVWQRRNQERAPSQPMALAQMSGIVEGADEAERMPLLITGTSPLSSQRGQMD
ncbi:autophagy-related protein 9A isoform X1 [Ischnura elegans]|uniref:autophagy-related protein 9A isoform X1 n=1 Tax=Ischnura elegans TaxID=197161 RepID=UPI001ED8AB0C|nr:autophagy-related protein 9A isoform X1 [Ischnura elegans]